MIELKPARINGIMQLEKCRGGFARKLDFNKEFDNIKITGKVYKKAVYRNTKFGLLVP